ncbi:MAG: NADP-dependent phosphogluconate dehydrogenase [Patescibacteria group bacterium]
MQLGVIGLGTMGANLARNAARNGAKIIVFNRSGEKTGAFLSAYRKEGTIESAENLSELCTKLAKPRKILLMVKADAVDEVLKELLPYLSSGDVLIDGGNSHYKDSERRSNILENGGMHFIGMGVSGGAAGALFGPSLMPGGSKEAYETIAPLLKKMAAEDGENGRCVAYIGTGGTGHFVKMVHNGIEYGIMQLIAECYHILKSEGRLSNTELSDVFEQWSKSEELGSFLLEITAEIFRMHDPDTGTDLIDLIKDNAGQKGTGKWTTETALEFGVSVPTITAGIDARIVSSAKDFRVQRSAKAAVALVDASIPKQELIAAVRSTLELSMIHTYAQGFQLLSVASGALGWNLPIGEIARTWRGGCIIRSTILKYYQGAFQGNQAAGKHLAERCGGERQKAWRSVVAHASERGIPVPALSASLSYYDGYRSHWLPQNLTQAQRDYFGTHGYERVDKEGSFHTAWKTPS